MGRHDVDTRIVLIAHSKNPYIVVCDDLKPAQGMMYRVARFTFKNGEELLGYSREMFRFPGGRHAYERLAK